MLGLFANLFLRSALILGAGVLLCGLLVRLRPAQRHGILLSAFVLLLVCPLFAAVLPEIVLPLWQGSPEKGSVTVQQLAVGRQAVPATRATLISPLWLWLVFAGAALAPLLAAHLRVRALVRRAKPNQDAEWSALLNELCGQIGLARVPTALIHPESLMPMAVGIWRPAILLPCDCQDWTLSRRRMVLLHELAHIARRDLATQLVARLTAACWWFQPLSWIALRLLRRESERACDALVIQSGIRPSDYAVELLAIAQTFTACPQLSAAGIAFAPTDALEGRLRSILKPIGKPSRRAGFAAISSLTVLAMAASAVNLLPESQPLLPRGHSMKRTLFAGLLASAGLSAATIGGSLYDPSGAAVPDAKAVLYDPDTDVKFETTTSPDGKFVFETLPAGEYILRVQKPGFATLFREFNVKEDAKVDRGLTLALGTVPEQVNVAAQGLAAVASETNPAKPMRVGGAVEQANLVQKVQPIYPTAAKAAGLQGKVLFEMVISKEGVPIDIRVLASPSDDLTQSALDAVRQWRYKPTLLNGEAVEIVTDVVVNYTLAK
jgi:TonB family protein